MNRYLVPFSILIIDKFFFINSAIWAVSMTALLLDVSYHYPRSSNSSLACEKVAGNLGLGHSFCEVMLFPLPPTTG